QRRLAHVDAGNGGASASHGLAEDAAAAAHVQHLLAGQADALIDPVDPPRADLVQPLALAFHVPPAVRKRVGTGSFRADRVAHDCFPETGAAAGGGKVDMMPVY